MYLNVVSFSEKSKRKYKKVKYQKELNKKKLETGGSENELKQTLDDFFKVAWFCFRPNVNV